MSRRRARRNGDHPEGEPEAWGEQPKWPPDEPQEELEGDTVEEKLQSGLAYLKGLPGLRARIRAFLIGEGMPELYAEIVAEDVAEGWANDDPAPLYTMPGFVPPQNDPSAVRGLLRAAVAAWISRGGTSNPPCQIASISEDSDDDALSGITSRDLYEILDDAEKLFARCGIRPDSHEKLFEACLTPDGRVLGASVVGLYSSTPDEEDPLRRPRFTFSIAVDELARRQGVARALVESVLHSFPSDEVLLEGKVVNPHMIPLLKEYGFVYEHDDHDEEFSPLDRQIGRRVRRPNPPRKLEAYVYDPGALLHVRVDYVDSTSRPPRDITVKPSVPRAPLGGEDASTPRVCLAPTLGGCLAAIEAWSRIGPPSIDGEDRVLVYQNVDPVEVVVPTRRLVADAPETGEVWALKPVRMRLIQVRDQVGMQQAISDVLDSMGDLACDADSAFSKKAALVDEMLWIEEDFLGRSSP